VKISRRKYENRVLEVLIREGVQKRSDLWHKIDWRENKRLFGDCLESLKKQLKIVEIKVESQKKPLFALAADAELAEKLRLDILKLDEFFPKAKNGIKMARFDRNFDRVAAIFRFVMVKELEKYLRSLALWATVEDKWKDVVEFLVVKYNVSYFAQLLKECRDANSETLEKALSEVAGALALTGEDLWEEFGGY